MSSRGPAKCRADVKCEEHHSCHKHNTYNHLLFTLHTMFEQCAVLMKNFAHKTQHSGSPTSFKLISSVFHRVTSCEQPMLMHVTFLFLLV